MRVGGFAAPSGASGGAAVAEPSAEEQLMEALSFEVKSHDTYSAKAQFNSVKEIISRMSPEQSKELYDRLQNEKPKDELAVLFNSTFKADQKRTLENLLKKQFSVSSTTGTGPKQQPGPVGTEKRSEVDLAGQTRAAELSKELAKQSRNRIFTDGVNDPQKVATSKKYTDAEKIEFYKKHLRNASPDDFKKLISDSEKWKSDDRYILDEALATPHVAKRAAMELGRGQQLEFMDRMFRTHAGDARPAIREYMANLDSESLNHVASHLTDLDYLESPDVTGRGVNASAVLRGLADRAGELTRDARLNLTNEAFRIKLDYQKDSFAEFEQAQTLQTILAKSSPEQKNQLIDDLQDRGKLDNLAETMKQLKELDPEALKGLNAENIDSLRNAFSQLVKESREANKEDDAHTYERLILQLDGWKQNHVR